MLILIIFFNEFLIYLRMIRDNYQFLFVFIIFRVSTIEYFKIEKIFFS